MKMAASSGAFPSPTLAGASSQPTLRRRVVPSCRCKCGESRRSRELCAAALALAILLLGTAAVTFTGFYGFVLATLDVQQRVLDQSTQRIVHEVTNAVLDATALANLNGWAWRRAALVVGSPLAPVFLIDQLLAAPNSSFVGQASTVYITDIHGNLQGVTRSDQPNTFYGFTYTYTDRCDTLYTLTSRGQFVKRIYRSCGTSTYDPRQRGWYQAAQSKNGTAAWSAPYPNAFDDKLVLTASVAVRDSTGQLIAVSAVDLPFSGFQSVLTDAFPLTNVDGFSNAQVLVFTKDGTVLASSNDKEKQVLQKDGITQLPLLTDAALSAETTEFGALLSQANTHVSCGVLPQPASCTDVAWTTMRPLVLSLRSIQGSNSLFDESTAWYVATIMRAELPYAARKGPFAVSAVTGFLIVLFVVGFVTGMLDSVYHRWCSRCSSAPAKSPSLLQRAAASDEGIEMSAIGGTSLAASIRMNAPPQRRRLQIRPWPMAATAVAVLVILYMVWGSSISEFSGLIAVLTGTLQNTVLQSADSFVERPPAILQQLQAAIGRNELPYDPSVMYHNATTRRNMESFMADLLLMYDLAYSPVQALIIGYNNGDVYSVAKSADGSLFVQYENPSTDGSLVFVGLNAIGVRNDSDIVSDPVPFSSFTRPWYQAGLTATKPTATSIYQFVAAAKTVVYGMTVVQHFADPHSNHSFVVGIDITLDLLHTLITNTGLSSNQGFVFLAEAKEGLPLLASSVGDITGCTGGSNGRFFAIDLPVDEASADAFKRVAIHAGAFLMDNTTSSELQSVGEGLNELLVAMDNIEALGMSWLLVAAFQKFAFVTTIFDVQTVTSIVVFACIIFVGVISSTVTLIRTRISALPSAAAIRATMNKSSSRHLQAAASPSMRGKGASPIVVNPTLSASGADRAAQRPLVELIGRETVTNIDADLALWLITEIVEGVAGGGAAASHTMNPLASDRQHMARTVTPLDVTVWRALSKVTGEGGPEPWTDISQACQVLQSFVKSAMRRTGYLSLLFLALQTNSSPFALALGRLVVRGVWRKLGIWVSWALMALAFAEAVVGVGLQPDVVRKLLIAESVLCALLVVQLLVLAYVRHVMGLDRFSRQELRASVMGWDIVPVWAQVLHAVLVTAVAVDVIVRWIQPYYTGPPEAMLALPVTAFIRPIMLFAQMPGVLQSASILVATVVQSRIALLILGTTLVSLTLVTASLNIDARVNDLSFIGEGFTDARAAGITMFMFLSTASNYNEVLAPFMDVSSWYAVYFVIIAFVGVFFIVSMLVAYFQRYYSQAYDMQQKASASIKRLRRRAALLISFNLLQSVQASLRPTSVSALRSPDSASCLSQGLIRQFFAHCGVNLRSAFEEERHAQKEFGTFACDAEEVSMMMHNAAACSDTFISAVEAFLERCKFFHRHARRGSAKTTADAAYFINLCEKYAMPLADSLSVDGSLPPASLPVLRKWLASVDVLSGRPVWQRKLAMYFDDQLPWKHESSITLILICHATLSALSTTYVNTFISWVLPIFVWLYVAELFVRAFVAESIWDFWAFSRLQGLDMTEFTHLRVALRADLVIVTVSAIWQGVGGQFYNVSHTLPLLRLLTSIRIIRDPLFRLFGALPSVSLVIMFIVLQYLYMVMGCWWFAGILTPPYPSYNNVNFDSFINALATMIHILAFEPQDVIYMTFSAIGNLDPVWYFFSYITIVGLMFINAVVGIVVDRFQNVEKERDSNLHKVQVQRQALHAAAARAASERSATLRKFFNGPVLRHARMLRRDHHQPQSSAALLSR